MNAEGKIRNGGKRERERKANSERKVRNGRTNSKRKPEQAEKEKERQYNLRMKELEMQDKVKPKPLDFGTYLMLPNTSGSFFHFKKKKLTNIVFTLKKLLKM